MAVDKNSMEFDDFGHLKLVIDEIEKETTFYTARLSDVLLITHDTENAGIVLDLENHKGLVFERMSEWAVRQLCDMVNAPVGFIARLPANLAGDALRHSLESGPAGKDIVVQVGNTLSGDTAVMSIATASFAESLSKNSDVLGAIERGILIPSAGAFTISQAPEAMLLTDRTMTVNIADGGGGLIELPDKTKARRGIQIVNSSVGAGKLVWRAFLELDKFGVRLTWADSRVRAHRGFRDELTPKVLEGRGLATLKTLQTLPTDRTLRAINKAMRSALPTERATVGTLRAHKISLEEAEGIAEAARDYRTPETFWGLVVAGLLKARELSPPEAASHLAWRVSALMRTVE